MFVLEINSKIVKTQKKNILMKTMKKIVFASLFQLIVVALVAQAPVMFNYQAVVRDNLGNPTSNEATEITITIT
jgi:hypothetical protein